MYLWFNARASIPLKPDHACAHKRTDRLSTQPVFPAHQQLVYTNNPSRQDNVAVKLPTTKSNLALHRYIRIEVRTPHQPSHVCFHILPQYTWPTGHQPNRTSSPSKPLSRSKHMTVYTLVVSASLPDPTRHRLCVINGADHGLRHAHLWKTPQTIPPPVYVQSKPVKYVLSNKSVSTQSVFKQSNVKNVVLPSPAEIFLANFEETDFVTNTPW